MAEIKPMEKCLVWSESLCSISNFFSKHIKIAFSLGLTNTLKLTKTIRSSRAVHTTRPSRWISTEHTCTTQEQGENSEDFKYFSPSLIFFLSYRIELTFPLISIPHTHFRPISQRSHWTVNQHHFRNCWWTEPAALEPERVCTIGHQQVILDVLLLISLHAPFASCIVIVSIVSCKHLLSAWAASRSCRTIRTATMRIGTTCELV